MAVYQGPGLLELVNGNPSDVKVDITIDGQKVSVYVGAQSAIVLFIVGTVEVPDDLPANVAASFVQMRL